MPQYYSPAGTPGDGLLLIAFNNAARNCSTYASGQRHW